MTRAEAIAALKKGGVVAFPTETFYGLGAVPTNRRAIEKIFKIKKRDRGKPIMLILSSTRQIDRWVVGISPQARKLMRHFWPGPLTLILKAQKGVSKTLTAGTGKLAVRVSSEKIARGLAAQIGGAITATSANRSGESPAYTAASARRKLRGQIDGIVSNMRFKKSKGSTIIDISDNTIKVIREGIISWAKIQKVFNQI